MTTSNSALVLGSKAAVLGLVTGAISFFVGHKARSETTEIHEKGVEIIEEAKKKPVDARFGGYGGFGQKKAGSGEKKYVASLKHKKLLREERRKVEAFVGEQIELTSLLLQGIPAFFFTVWVTILVADLVTDYVMKKDVKTAAWMGAVRGFVTAGFGAAVLMFLIVNSPPLHFRTVMTYAVIVAASVIGVDLLLEVAMATPAPN